MNPIKIILLVNNQTLISQIEEQPSELGEPDCKLINPFILNLSDFTLSPWMSDYSIDTMYMIHSDKILTIAEPKKSFIEKYQNLIK